MQKKDRLIDRYMKWEMDKTDKSKRTGTIEIKVLTLSSQKIMASKHQQNIKLK